MIPLTVTTGIMLDPKVGGIGAPDAVEEAKKAENLARSCQGSPSGLHLFLPLVVLSISAFSVCILCLHSLPLNRRRIATPNETFEDARIATAISLHTSTILGFFDKSGERRTDGGRRETSAARPANEKWAWQEQDTAPNACFIGLS